MATFDPDAYLAQKPFDPDGYLKTSPGSMVAAHPETPTKGWLRTNAEQLGREALDSIPAQFGFGSARGIGGIGATLGLQGEEGRKAVEKYLVGYGANPESLAYGAGKLGSEIGATGGVGSLLARGVSMIPNAASKVPALIEALRTSGMSSGALGGAKGLLARVGGGAATGATGAGVTGGIDEAGAGAVIGGAMPVAGKILSTVGGFISPERLMQSALKPTLAQQKSGEAKTAIDTLLKYGINATQGGAEKLKSMVRGVDDEISNLIAGSGKTVSKEKVLSTLGDVESKFANQVSPTSDIAAIQNVGADFARHPLIDSGDIPIELAQKLKQGTYKIVDKKYGQLGSAEIEAQKGLARGLKEQMAEAVPAVAPLNAKQSELIKALKVTGRRAMMDDNRNPVGLAGLSQSPSQLAAMLADRSALLKSLAARGMNRITPEEGNLVINALRQGAYRGAPVSLTD
jgi:hypothetical protein